MENPQLTPPPLIDDLMNEHREELARMMSELQPELDPEDPVKQDELFVLRFLLSHHQKGTDAAVEACRKTILWRKERHEKHREWHSWIIGDTVGEREAVHPAHVRKVGHWWVGRLHNYTDYMEPVTTVRVGLANPCAIRKAGLMDLVFELMSCLKEQNWFIIDEASRHTGSLCKYIQVLDFANMGFRNVDQKFGQKMGEIGQGEDSYYPQLLRANVIINPPFLMTAIWSVIKFFLSKPTREKTIFCGSDATRCPFLQAHLPCAKLPSFIQGGECVCTNLVGGQCCAVSDNDQTELAKQGGMVKLNVPSRERYTEELTAVFEGIVIYWCFEIEEHGIEFEMTFKSNETGEVDEFHPLKKYKAPEGMQQGQYTTNCPGVATFVFNNDYSVVRSKDLKYFITIVN